MKMSVQYLIFFLYSKLTVTKQLFIPFSDPKSVLRLQNADVSHQQPAILGHMQCITCITTNLIIAMLLFVFSLFWPVKELMCELGVYFAAVLWKESSLPMSSMHRITAISSLSMLFRVVEDLHRQNNEATGITGITGAMRGAPHLRCIKIKIRRLLKNWFIGLVG